MKTRPVAPPDEAAAVKSVQKQLESGTEVIGSAPAGLGLGTRRASCRDFLQAEGMFAFEVQASNVIEHCDQLMFHDHGTGTVDKCSQRDK
jgi:hypothetical protein